MKLGLLLVAQVLGVDIICAGVGWISQTKGSVIHSWLEIRKVALAYDNISLNELSGPIVPKLEK